MSKHAQKSISTIVTSHLFVKFAFCSDDGAKCAELTQMKVLLEMLLRRKRE